MASLIERYKQLLQPVGQKLSQVGKSLNTAANVVEQTPFGIPSRVVKSAGQTILNLATKSADYGRQSYDIGAANRAAGKSSINPQSLMASAKGIISGAGTLASVASGGKNPVASISTAGIGGLMSRATGGSFSEGAGQGLAYSGAYNKIASVTNPYLAKIMPRNSTFFASRATPAVANVGQGILTDLSTGQKTTPLSVGIDALSGAVGKQGQFSLSSNNLDDILKKGKALGIDGVSPRVNKVHPEDLDVMREFADKIIRQKGAKQELGELGVSAQRLAEHYFGGKWRTADNKKLAQAFEWAIDLNMNIPREARGKLPKLGIAADQEQSVISQIRQTEGLNTARKAQTLRVQTNLSQSPDLGYTSQRTASPQAGLLPDNLSVKNQLPVLKNQTDNRALQSNQISVEGKIPFSSTESIPLKPRKLMLKQADELLAQGQEILGANRAKAEMAAQTRAMFSNDTLDLFENVKRKASSRIAQEGDVETMRKLLPETEIAIQEYRSRMDAGDGMSDEDALAGILDIPNKGTTKVGTPLEIKAAKQLQLEASKLRDTVFNSETDLPTKEKLLKENQSTISKAAQQDFKEWEKQLVKQEKLKTSAGQATRNLDQAAKILQNQTVPGYVKQIKSDISSMGKGLTDVYRNFDKVFGKNSQAHKDIIEPFNKSKGQLVNDLESWADSLEKNVVKRFGFKKGTKESAAIQQYGENKRTTSSLVKEFGQQKAKQIIEADKWFRTSYDQLLSEVNAVRKQIYPNDPDKIIPRRSDYYRHFVDLSDTFSGLRNLFDTPANISPELAGLSARTLPKSKWLSFAQKRLGNKTTDDAVGGFIEYIKAQSYAKNIDPHIDRFRKLREDIVKVTDDPKSPNYAQANNFVEYLDDFANDLAGKTNEYDRAVQKLTGRKAIQVLNWINSRTKANMIVGNLSSAVAQFFNIPQGIAEAGILNSVKGLGRSARDLIDGSGAIQQSRFVKERYSGDIFNKFDTGILANTKKAAVWITGIGDEVGTKLIWNSIYEDALSKGVKNPVDYADDITRKMVAGRGVGEVPLLQKAKVFQLVAPFQLEVANVWHVMRDWAGEKAASKFVTFFVASHIMNRMAANLRGSDVSLDPIQAVKEAYEAYQEEDDKKIGIMRAGGRLAGEAISNLPGGQSIGAIYPEFGVKVGDTQLPTRENFFGEGDPTRFGGGLLAAKALQDPLYSILPSYGGKQIKKTLEGIKAYNRGYSETKSGAVRFPIENDATNQVKTGLFGEYGAKEARDYFDKEKKPLGESQTEIFKTLSKEQGKEYLDAIDQERAINRVFKELEEGNIDEQEAESLITKANASGEFSPLTDTKNKALREKLDAFTKKKIKLGLDVTEKELESAYLGIVSSMPPKSKYEKAIKDSKLYSLSSSIYGDEDLSESQKQLLNSKVASQIGIKAEDLEYYQVANDENNLKTIYVLEALQGQENVIPYLEQGRRKVNEKQLVSNGVIDNLVDEGLISDIEGKRLKKIDFDRNGEPKSQKGSAKKPKIITPEMPKIPTIKLSSPRVRKIKTRKTPEYKIRKIRLKSGLKKTKKLTLR